MQSLLDTKIMTSDGREDTSREGIGICTTRPSMSLAEKEKVSSTC